jgi:hypothetical protein
VTAVFVCQVELEAGTCKIPRDILATRKEVVIVMMDRIRLQVAASSPDPLVRKHPSIESHGSFTPASSALLETSLEQTHPSIAEPLRNIAHDHIEQDLLGYGWGHRLGAGDMGEVRGQAFH